jgi:hypothetical protein
LVADRFAGDARCAVAEGHLFEFAGTGAYRGEELVEVGGREVFAGVLYRQRAGVDHELTVCRCGCVCAASCGGCDLTGDGDRPLWVGQGHEDGLLGRV